MKFYKPNYYQPKCEQLFRKYRNGLQSLLPSAVIEHVGSSSIPMAISKGDLDIFVGVNYAELEDVVRVLCENGFSEKLNTMRTSELCMLESNAKDNVALQVVALGSKFEFFLTFRDRLRKSTVLVSQYNEIKKSCEGLSHQDYRVKKSKFIEQVLADI